MSGLRQGAGKRFLDRPLPSGIVESSDSGEAEAHEPTQHQHTYLAEQGHTSGPLLRDKDQPHKGLMAATISHYVRNWMWAAGIKQRPGDGRSAHGLRRTCLSELMEACGDVQVVQTIAGHARPDTTIRHYLRPVSDVRLREAMAKRESAA